MSRTRAAAWMPFFGDDYWDSEHVAEMDDSAALLYSWLLWRQWKHGPLPGPDVLRRLPHRWQACWDVVWPQVAARFAADASGRLVNARLASERAAALQLEAAAREKGRKGGLSAQAKRAEPNKPKSSPATTTAQAQLNNSSATTQAQVNTGPDRTGQSESSSLPDPVFPERDAQAVETPPPPKTALRAVRGKPRRVLVMPEIPASLDTPEFRDALAELAAYRREQGLKPRGPIGMSRLFKKLRPLGVVHAIASINDSMASNYQGVVVNGRSSHEPKGFEGIRNRLAGKRTAIDSLLPLISPAKIPGASR